MYITNYVFIYIMYVYYMSRDISYVLYYKGLYYFIVSFIHEK